MKIKVIALTCCFAFLFAGCKNKSMKWSWPKWGRNKDKAPETTAVESTGSYSDEGVLRRSELFIAAPGQPQRFLLCEPDTLAIKAYVQAADASVDVDSYVGSLVKVTGTVQQDAAVGLVIEAQEIRVIDRKAGPSGVPPGRPDDDAPRALESL